MELGLGPFGSWDRTWTFGFWRRGTDLRLDFGIGTWTLWVLEMGDTDPWIRFWNWDTDPLDLGDGTQTLGLDLEIGTQTLWILEMGRGPSDFRDGARTLGVFRMGQTLGIFGMGRTLGIGFPDTDS